MLHGDIDGRQGGDEGGGDGDLGSTKVIDFEDEDLSAFSSGSVEDFNFQTSGAQQGDVWLQLTGTAGYAQMGSQSGLNAYPQPGDEFASYVYLGDAGATAQYTYIGFGAQSAGDTDNFSRVDPDAGIFELNLGGTNYSTPYAASVGTWYVIRVQWDDGSTFGGASGEFTAYLEDLDGNVLASITETDDTVSAGGIVLGGSNEPGWDDYSITNR